jgi:tetratricopeptide (TPR) repeat protein
MAGGCGNCMGLSSLYLAVAERLELPIRGVEAPAHVFVRWDDGTFRRNIEATERGVEHDDRWYATRGDGLSIRDEDVKSGAYLSNISKRRFLALALVNRSDSEAKAGRAARAVEDAEWAVRLAPELANARVDRASRLTDTDPARAAEDLRAAEKSRRLSPGESMVATDTYVKLGLVDDAIRLADAACVAYPADVGVTLRRANALACARRFDLARRAIDDLPDDARKRPDVRLADVELGFVAGDSSWRDRLADAVEDPVEDPRIHLVLAEHLLDGIAGAAPSPSDATYVLDLVARITLPRTLRSSSDFREAMTRSAAIHDEIGHPKRRYYELRVRCARALHDEAGVAAAESALRDIDAKK